MKAGILLPSPQNFPISGESSEMPFLISMKSDVLPWQSISMVRKETFTYVPLGKEMRYTQSANSGYIFGCEGDVRMPLEFV